MSSSPAGRVVLGLLLCIASACCGVGRAADAPLPAGGTYEAWRQHSLALQKDPSLIRYYTFENLGRADREVPSLVGQGGALTLGVAGAPAGSSARLTLVSGRWPQKKAVRLDREFLAAKPFEVRDKGFTVAAWHRTSGQGTIRGDSVVQGGTLLSAGTGYWDGFRLTLHCPDKRLGFEIGRPKPSSSIGIHTEPQGDGVWRHLAATWDGQTMRLYLDGSPVAEGPYAGAYAPPGKGAAFRIGFAGSGWGSVILEVDEVAVFSRALTPGDILQLAYFYAPVSTPLAERLVGARDKAVGKDFAGAAAAYQGVLGTEGVPADLLAVARLGLAQIQLDQKRPAEASAHLTRVVEMPGVTAGHRKTALGILRRLVREAGVLPGASILETLLQEPELSPPDRVALRFALARKQRDEGNLAGAREQYEKLVSSRELLPCDRCDARLELAHACFAAGQYAAARAEYATLVDAVDVPAPYPSLAQLQIGASHVREKDYGAARTAYAKLGTMPAAPRHHRWEARECLRELERLQAGLSARDPAWSRVQLPKRPAPGVEFYVAPEGSDTHSGTSERPFATLERARDAIRQLKAQGNLPRGGAVVSLRGGRHPRKETFRLAAEDSGTAESPIVYRAAAGQGPVLDAGMRLAGFQTVRDPAILARLPEAARGKVLQCDLKAQGVTDWGEVRARGYGASGVPVLEVFFGGKPMPLARWPNEGFVQVGKAIASGEEAGRGTTFEYEGDRPARWSQARDLWLYGYWQHYWADGSLRVASIDPNTRQIRLSGGRAHGIQSGKPYLAFNLLEEIDEPGEWYLDRATGILYFYRPAEPAGGVVQLSMLSKPMVEMDGVSHVTLQGLVLELGRAGGIIVRGGHDCLVAGCTVRRLGGDGVIIQRGARHGVLSCDLHTLGRGGTRVEGGDRKTLAPSGHFVENCHIYDFSRIDRTYTPAVWTDGVGTRIAHNLYHDSPGHGMRLEGNDHLVEFNEAHNVVWESDDQAAMEMYGNPTYRGVVFRYNYFHDIANRFDRPCGQAGIRLDDGICGVLIYGNVFCRCSNALFGAVQIHGGKENAVDNNVFVDCKHAVSFSGWGQKRWEAFLASPHVATSIKAVDAAKPPYSTRYPELARLADNADVNIIWRNLVCQCGQFLARDRGIQDVASNGVTDQYRGIVDAKRLDFLLGPQAESDRAGMRPIPVSEIGLYQDEFRPSRPTCYNDYGR